MPCPSARISTAIGSILLLVILLGPLLGCRALRAEVGYGVGVGVGVKIPLLLHTGFAFGIWKHWGSDYGYIGQRPPSRVEEGEDLWDVTVTHLVKFKHHESRRRQRNNGFEECELDADDIHAHECSMLLPLSLAEKGYTYHDYALEVGVMLVFVDLRLGLNPWFWFNTLPDEDGDSYELDFDLPGG